MQDDNISVKLERNKMRRKSKHLDKEYGCCVYTETSEASCVRTLN